MKLTSHWECVETALGFNVTFTVTGKVDEKATQLHAIASLKVLLDATAPHKGSATASSANYLKETTLVTRQAEPNGIAVQSSSVSFCLSQAFFSRFDYSNDIPTTFVKQEINHVIGSNR